MLKVTINSRDDSGLERSMTTSHELTKKEIEDWLVKSKLPMYVSVKMDETGTQTRQCVLEMVKDIYDIEEEKRL